MALNYCQSSGCDGIRVGDMVPLHINRHGGGFGGGFVIAIIRLQVFKYL